MRRALATLLVTGGMLIGAGAATVQAATAVDAGWWDRNGNALLPQIDPPPEGAIRVANDPAGASAVAAVRFQLDEGEEGPTLTLRVAGDPVPDGAAFVACPATSEWASASGAPLSEAPESDCETTAALGLVAGDGTAVAFDLSQLPPSPIVDVVISPAPTGASPITDTFAVDFEAPADTDLTVAGAAPVAPPVPGGTFSGGGGSPAPAIGTGGGSSSPSFSPSPSSGGFTAPAAPSVTVPGVQSPTGGSPAATPPTTPVLATDEVATAPLVASTSSGARWVGLLTAVLVIGLGAHLWRTDRTRSAMTAGPVLGGLGPFARERSGPAPEVA